MPPKPLSIAENEPSEAENDIFSAEMKIGSAYIRVSDERQDEYSPESQLKLVRKYAKEHGYMVPDEYVFYDDGISAKSVKKRVAFNSMIALAKEKSHPIDAIFVWKFSRFARNQEESIVYKSLLKKNDVDVISISEPLDGTPFGSLIERIIEWMDEYYLIRLSGEVRRGMLEKVSRGEPVCAPPMGYDLVKKQLVPNADADIVRYVFRSYANGVKQRALSLDLADKGVRTRYGNKPDNRFVDYMLRNPVYIGKIRWSREGNAASARDYDNENIIIADGHHEPLISMELWEQVQAALKLQKLLYSKYQRPEANPEWMLKGLLRCGTCGSTLIRSCINTKFPGVQCSRYNHGGGCSVSHFMTMDKIIESVISGIEESIAKSTYLSVPKTDAQQQTQTTNYDRLITLEQKRLTRCQEAYANGIDTLEEYATNKQRIQKKIEQLTKKRDAAPDTSADTEAFTNKLKTVLRFIKIKGNSEQSKNEALRSVIEKIVFEKDPTRFVIYYQI